MTFFSEPNMESHELTMGQMFDIRLYWKTVKKDSWYVSPPGLCFKHWGITMAVSSLEVSPPLSNSYCLNKDINANLKIKFIKIISTIKVIFIREHSHYKKYKKLKKITHYTNIQSLLTFWLCFLSFSKN